MLNLTNDLNIKYFIGKAQVDLNKMIISIDEKNKKINTSEKKVLIDKTIDDTYNAFGDNNKKCIHNDKFKMDS